MNGGGDRSERELRQADRAEDDRRQDGGASDDSKNGGRQQDSDAHKDAQKKNDEGSEASPAEGLALVPFVLVAIFVIGFIGVVLWLVFKPRPNVWTDDAYVRVHYAKISPRISGRVIAVSTEDNQAVRDGDLLVAIDPRDFETAVAEAEAALARDTARVEDAGGMVERQPALIDEQLAAVATADAALQLAQENTRRYSNLAATGAGTVQERQQANNALRAAEAQQLSATASLRAARRQLDVLKAQAKAAEGTAELDRAKLDQAKLNLSYTHIAAPLDGVVGERAVQVGDYVTPGMTMMAVVPLRTVYITANYREEDLRHMRRGQKATIHVDAYNISLDGLVDDLPPASGATFTPIAPNNATGNFTKIVQRLPVRIVIVPGQPLANLLRVGFSVETTVHTDLENIVGEDTRGTDPASPVR